MNTITMIPIPTQRIVEIAASPGVSGRLREPVAFWAALAEEPGRPYRTDIEPATAFVRLARVDLEAVLDAVSDNVFAYTPEHTPFAVSLSPVGGRASPAYSGRPRTRIGRQRGGARRQRR
jgi:hypothetical protein